MSKLMSFTATKSLYFFVTFSNLINFIPPIKFDSKILSSLVYVCNIFHRKFTRLMADLKGVKRENKKSDVQKVIEETGLSEVQNKLNRHLSRGYKQRVSMAGALVGNPKVLILDEPTVGLNLPYSLQILLLLSHYK